MAPDRKLLVLDLDETLVYAWVEDPARPGLQPEHTLPWTPPVYVVKRPFLHKFLAQAGTLFELMLWSASGERYVRDVLGATGCAGFFGRIWSADRCTWRFVADRWGSVGTKPLKKLKRHGYDLRHVLMVDDDPQKFQPNYGNGMAVKPFEGDPQDRELLRLLRYLRTLAGVDNVRVVEKRWWVKQTPDGPDR